MGLEIEKCEVLFVNPPSPDGHIYIRDLHRCGRRSREGTIWPQTSLASLAAVAQNSGYTANLLDCIASDISWQQYLDYIKKAKPKWTIVIAIPSVVLHDIYATYIGKRFDSKTVVVGPHITAIPEKIMEAFPTIDYGILGEAEQTLAELLNAVDNCNDLKHIKGLVYRKNGQLVQNEKRALIENLDSLAMPLYELLPIDKYSLPYIGKRYTSVLHSRGCPFSCSFCRQIVMWKCKPRFRSPDIIIEELKYLKTLNISNIIFHSDTFTINKENVLEICNKIIDNKLKIRWICNAREDTVDTEMLKWMKKSGCWMINYGLESGVQEILDNCNKGKNATIEKAREAVLMTKRAGIKVWAYFMIGLPGETPMTIKQTSRFARSLPLDMVNFSVATPYPGTPFYEQAIENNWLKSVEWEDFDQNYSAIIGYPELSGEQMIQGVKRCYIEWFARPRGLGIFLKGMSSWVNISKMAKIALSHLTMAKDSKAFDV
jgi:radical SAM superfamily enzyme YgiQ (UPF0313 family)